jgi:hypothetical protein
MTFLTRTCPIEGPGLLRLGRSIMRLGWPVAASFIMVCTGSCTHSQTRDELVDEIYPPEALRADIVERYGEPMESHRPAEERPAGFAAAAIKELERESGAVVASWDFYMTLRGGLASKLGAFGLFGDYLFYDKDHVLIRARRRWLD